MKLTFSLILLLAVSSVVGQAQEIPPGEAIRISTTLVSVPVVASDRQGRYVAGLKVEDFTLYQDGVKQTISYFGTEEEPLNVALLLDTSRSTQAVLEKIKDAARDFIRLLQPADRAMVVSFDFQANALSAMTNDRKRIEKAIKEVEIGARVGTVMRDAVIETIEGHMTKFKGRKAIILLTDGKDHGSAISDEALLDRLEESDVLVYSVYYETKPGFLAGRGPMGQRRGMGRGRMGGIGIPGIPGGGGGGRNGGRATERQKRANENAVEYLEQLSEISAGRFYQKDVTDLKATFVSIADELRRQYRLGFYPPDGDNAAAAVHSIRVKVARHDVAVRSRKTYRTH